MPYHCPACGAHISSDDINPGSDRAVCQSCGTVSSFHQIKQSAEALLPSAPPLYDLNNPPNGTWFRQFPDGFQLGASTRSWNALVFAVMVLLFPILIARANQPISGGRYGHTSSTPDESLIFLLIALFLFCFVSFILNIAGKVEVTQTQGRLTIFTGVGSIGWKRNFSWFDFRAARETEKGSGKSRRTVIQLEGRYGAAFGSLLTDSRRCYVAAVLSKMLQDASRSSTK